MATIGLIPAAGYATRLQPLDVSKEVYPIGGRPVMDYLIERMRLGGCDELRVSIRPGKEDVAENARRQGATVVEGRPESLAESLLLALGDAPDDDSVLLGFPDSLWQPPDGYARLTRSMDSSRQVSLGLFRPAESDLPRYEPVLFDDSGRVLGIEFKPERPSSRWIWGCAVTSAGVLRGLGTEQEPGRYFDSLSAQGVVGCVRLSDSYLDIGTPEGLRAALSAAQ